MLKHMGNVSRELELLRKNQKEMLKINTVTEIKNVFDGLISRLHTWGKNFWAKGYLSRIWENFSKENKDWKKKPEQNIQEHETTTKGVLFS